MKITSGNLFFEFWLTYLNRLLLMKQFSFTKLCTTLASMSTQPITYWLCGSYQSILHWAFSMSNTGSEIHLVSKTYLIRPMTHFT